MKTHVVRAGDCLTSIAYENGFFWQKLWAHPENAELREKRKDPCSLAPGDVVRIPGRKEKTCDREVDKRHVFRLKGVPSRIRLQFLDVEGKPRGGEPYELEIDGTTVVSGATTDAEGWIDHPISPVAAVGRLILLRTREEFRLSLGHLRPIEELIGVKMRLANLGYYDGPLDDREDDDFGAALLRFQIEHDLEATGELDQPTRDAIERACGG